MTPTSLQTLAASTPSSAAALVDVHDTTSLRRFLIAGMKDVMHGSITTWQAKAACNFAQQIYNVTALEVKVMLAQEKLLGKTIAAVSFDGGRPSTSPISGAPGNNGVGVGASGHRTVTPNAHTPSGRARRPSTSTIAGK